MLTGWSGIAGRGRGCTQTGLKVTKYLKTQLLLQEEAASAGAKQLWRGNTHRTRKPQAAAGAKEHVSSSCCGLAIQCLRIEAEEEPGAQQKCYSWSSDPSPQAECSLGSLELIGNRGKPETEPLQSQVQPCLTGSTVFIVALV